MNDGCQPQMYTHHAAQSERITLLSFSPFDEVRTECVCE